MQNYQTFSNPNYAGHDDEEMNLPRSAPLRFQPLPTYNPFHRAIHYYGYYLMIPAVLGVIAGGIYAVSIYGQSVSGDEMGRSMGAGGAAGLGLGGIGLGLCEMYKKLQSARVIDQNNRALINASLDQEIIVPPGTLLTNNR